MQNHLSPLELQKIIKKDRRRSKKTLFVYLNKPIDTISVFYKEPSQERKLFIAFDVVINLDLFNQQNDLDSIPLFSDFNVWRAPVRIERKLIPNACLPQISQQLNIKEKYSDENEHHSHSSTDSDSVSQSTHHKNNKSEDKIEGIKKEDEEVKDSLWINNNYLIEIELDTNNTGAKVFKEFAKVLNSIPNEKAHVLAEKIVLYQEFVTQYLLNYQIYERSLTKILSNLQEENLLDLILHEQMELAYSQARRIVEQKIQQHKFVSYIIKINKEGQSVIKKFGYSRAFLDIMGVESNYEQFFMRRGTINPFNPRNRLDRLISGLQKKAFGYQKKIADKYEDYYTNEEIYTFDNIVFKANYNTEKLFLIQSDQYFMKSSFLLQVATFEISDETMRQIGRIRRQNCGLQSGVVSNQDKEIQDLQYNCESEIFLNKYYIH